MLMLKSIVKDYKKKKKAKILSIRIECLTTLWWRGVSSTLELVISLYLVVNCIALSSESFIMQVLG